MTATLAGPVPEAGRRRRPGAGLAVGVGLLAAVAVVIVLGADDRREGHLDPANPGPDGAQAVARVLEDQGVDLTVVRSAEGLADADPDDATTVVVTSTWALGESTLGELRGSGAGRVVLVEPGPGLMDALGRPEDSPSSLTLDDPVEAGCSDPTYDGLSLLVDDALAYPVDGCFPATAGGHLLALAEPDLVLLGAGGALSNDQVLRADNAALALRLLGGSERLVWYVPSFDDVDAGEGVSLGSLLPSWLRPALWLTAVAALGLLLWRARRLGPLAVEPLPVTVKAIETTRSRGRLYRKAGDRAHAAAVLRGAARARAASRLGTGHPVDPGTLVQDVARHTGRPVAEVEALLSPTAPAPATDHDLVALADQLAELDREVRRP
ncbi:DUF4350 domain-containing protein [Nocardioides sp. MAH-18]|uniref:DUF4350 domain-containing protein n=1 Tax=Nocardioides agri TaxID=2682843 RepID=A0A6L6XUA0_9ACTN|nr:MULTISPECIES: DUF4350 domain-containing protein [unclassified Nocardioides]MBA2954354.1 DUF4350 domain-containing protein [Nocardioides sp. CGMCC 1.13656]MVQ49215.1 DUF4350 domain-containing protein [Nocardioides sp. MAH-18]